MKVAYLSDDFFLRHETGYSHPESPDRLSSINDRIGASQLKLIHRSPMSASIERVGKVHSVEQIEQIERCSTYRRSVDSDTVCSADSFDAALLAVGAGMVAVDGIYQGAYARAFCAVRPPGHHATPTQSMGFCLFNNIAITAKYAQEKGYHKVMIIDFDVHHGNGTQDTFYADDTVFYFSTHQEYAYPGTGSHSERGEGEGVGYTANFPLMPYSGDEDILEIYEEILPSYVDSFAPDIILVSAGYDLHESDPLASLNVTTEGIRAIVRSILESAEVPFVFFLEGGYDVDALARNVEVTLEEMLL